MTKAELIDAIAADAGISKKVAKRALDAFIQSVTNTLKNGESVSIKGFGTFSISNRAARSGRNPQTGKEIQIASKRVVRFKTSGSLIQKGTGDGGPRRK